MTFLPLLYTEHKNHQKSPTFFCRGLEKFFFLRPAEGSVDVNADGAGGNRRRNVSQIGRKDVRDDGGGISNVLPPVRLVRFDLPLL